MIKTQTLADMRKAGASDEESIEALEVWRLLEPGLIIKKTGRTETTAGDKTPLGLYRTLRRTMKEVKR